MGPAGSTNWHAMLDGAEDILREQGYGALTSRAVAERIGVKQRLVYYYFQTMEELTVATFRRLAERELERLRRARASARPLQEIWDICVHTSDARLISEFMALANRIGPLRDEVIAFIEDSREIQVSALREALQREPRASTLPAEALAIIATSVALALTREAQLGIRSGHPQMSQVIATFLSSAEAAERG
jgi:AcrR family transcriptional regulator